MKDSYTRGACHCCLKETIIRYIDICHRGSEGLWVCQPCENKIVVFIQSLCSDTISKKLKIAKDKNGNKNYRQ